MALTLIEAVKAPGTTTENRTIVETFAREVPALSLLPFIDIGGMTHLFTREKELPAPDYRQVNDSTTIEMIGKTEQVTDTLKPLQGDITIDNMIVQGGPAMVQAQLMMGTVAVAHKWQRTFFKGNSQSSVAEFDGLVNRIRATQTIDAGSTDGGDALSLAKLDEAVDACKNPNVIFMNKTLLRRIGVFLRDNTKHQLMYDIEMVGKRLARWAGIPVVPVSGRTPTEEVLAFDETGSGGSTATASSIIVASLGMGRLVGIRNGLPTMRNLGEMETKTAQKWRIDWFNNFSLMDEWSAIRLRGVKDDAVVA